MSLAKALSYAIHCKVNKGLRMVADPPNYNPVFNQLSRTF